MPVKKKGKKKGKKGGKKVETPSGPVDPLKPDYVPPPPKPGEKVSGETLIYRIDKSIEFISSEACVPVS